jgi:hypothetical protein
VGLLFPLAQTGGYWLAGILTVVAAAVVTAVILTTSHTDQDEAR